MTGVALLRADPGLAPHPPLVDVHVHLAADNGDGLPAQQWSALAAQAGIRLAGVVTPARPHYSAANAALLAWAQNDQPGVRPYARLGGPVPVTTRELWQLRSVVRSRLRARPPDVVGLDVDPVAALRLYAGVKVTPQIDGVPDAAVLSAVQELGLPLFVPAGEGCPPAAVEALLVRHLTSPVVLCHLGSYPGSAPDLAAALDLARRHPNVHLETSAAWLAEFVTIAAREVPDQLMFGSGAPFVHPLVAWHHVASAVADDALLEQIGHANAQRVLGW